MVYSNKACNLDGSDAKLMPLWILLWFTTNKRLHLTYRFLRLKISFKMLLRRACAVYLNLDKCTNNPAYKNYPSNSCSANNIAQTLNLIVNKLLLLFMSKWISWAFRFNQWVEAPCSFFERKYYPMRQVSNMLNNDCECGMLFFFLQLCFRFLFVDSNLQWIIGGIIWYHNFFEFDSK